ncbi:hypothetical protein PVAG01_04680 [Phlyctema vagabunda]|uniref:Telomeric single stranded DNA binding POT1/Cdc13 domain-containing protein n=1 Tax=Phlyctema vagabunda TaxID=108571 RepID=A0ABR4PI69_9HELO
MEAAGTGTRASIEATKHIPIAQLTPLLVAPSSRSLTAEVTIAWPYSSATDSVSFLLAEPDFRLRRTKGQVRAQFGGSSAKAVAKAGITSGDEVVLCLDGVEWLNVESTPGTPGRGVDFELKFTERLLLQFRSNDSQQSTIIDIDHPEPDTEVSAQPRIRTPSPEVAPGPQLFSSTGAGAATKIEAEEWASPAFIKRARTSYGSLFDSTYDPFEDEDGTITGKGRKRAKTSRLSRQWRYTSRSPTPEIETPEPPRAPEEEAEVQTETVPQEATSTVTTVMTDEAIQTQGFEAGNAAETLAEFSRQFTNAVPLASGTAEQVPSISSENTKTAQDQEETPQNHISRDDFLPVQASGTLASVAAASIEQQIQLPDISEIEALDAIRELPLSPRLNPLSSDGLPLVSPLMENRTGIFGAPERSGPFDVGHNWGGQFPTGLSDSTLLEQEFVHDSNPISMSIENPGSVAELGNLGAEVNLQDDGIMLGPQVEVENQYGHWQSVNDAASQPVTPYSTIDQVPQTTTDENSIEGLNFDAQYHDDHSMAESPLVKPQFYPELEEVEQSVPGTQTITDTWTTVDSTVTYPRLPITADAGDENGYQARSRSTSHQPSRPLSRSRSLRSDPIDLTEEDDEEELQQVESGDEALIVEERNEEFADHSAAVENEYVSADEYSDESELAEENSRPQNSALDSSHEDEYDEEEDYDEEAMSQSELAGEQDYDSDDEGLYEGTNAQVHSYDELGDTEEEYSDEDIDDGGMSRPNVSVQKEPELIDLISDDEDEMAQTSQDKEEAYSEDEEQSEDGVGSSDEEIDMVQVLPGSDRQEQDENESSGDEIQDDIAQESEDASGSDESISDDETDLPLKDDEDNKSDSVQNNEDSEMVDIISNEPAEAASAVKIPIAHDLERGSDSDAPISTTSDINKEEAPLRAKIAAAFRKDNSLFSRISEQNEALGAQIDAALRQEMASDESLKTLLEELSVVKSHWGQIKQSFEALNSTDVDMLAQSPRDDEAARNTDRESAGIVDAPPATSDIVPLGNSSPQHAVVDTEFEMEIEEEHDIQSPEQSPQQVASTSLQEEDEIMNDDDTRLPAKNDLGAYQSEERKASGSAAPASKHSLPRKFSMDGADDDDIGNVVYPELPDEAEEMSSSEPEDTIVSIEQPKLPKSVQGPTAQLPTPGETQIPQTVEHPMSDSNTSFVTEFSDDSTAPHVNEVTKAIAEHIYSEVANDQQVSQTVLAEETMAAADVYDEDAEDFAISQQIMREEEAHYVHGDILNLEDLEDDLDSEQPVSQIDLELVSNQEHYFQGKILNLEDLPDIPGEDSGPKQERNNQRESADRGVALEKPSETNNELTLEQETGTHRESADGEDVDSGREVPLKESDETSDDLVLEQEVHSQEGLPAVQEITTDHEKDTAQELETTTDTVPVSRPQHHSQGEITNMQELDNDRSKSANKGPDANLDEELFLEQVMRAEARQHALENLTQSPITPVRRSARNMRTSTPGSTQSNFSVSLDIGASSPQGYDASVEMALSALESPTRNTSEVRKPAESSLKLRLTKALRTELSEFTSLKLIRYHMNKKIDVLAIATTATPEPQRAKGGPRHYQISFNVTDPLIGPSHVTEVQVFRPYKDALPIIKAGDGVLLRNFQVLSIKGGFALRSEQNESSSWAVYKDDGSVEVRGPPVEHGDGEKEHIATLKGWYAGLDTVARAKVARANGEDVTGVKTRAKKAL